MWGTFLASRREASKAVAPDPGPFSLPRSPFAKLAPLMNSALVLLVVSLFTPWWFLNARISDGVFLRFGPESGPALFAPLWSPFVLSAWGTKLSTHFWNLLVLLLASLGCLTASRILLVTRTRWAAYLAIAASAFSAVGLLMFSITFPRIAYSGRVFWPGGAFASAEAEVSWVLAPGWILAAASLGLQGFLAVRLTRTSILSSQGPESVPPLRRPSWRTAPSTRVSVIVVSFLLFAALIWVGSAYSPKISAAGLQNESGFEPGDRATVWGRVTGVQRVPTSYGVYTILALDDIGFVSLAGDWTARYPVGSFAQIDVSFQTYTYNGIPFIWAERGYQPVPMVVAIATVLGAVSSVMGVILAPLDPVAQPSRIDVLTANGFPIDTFEAALVPVQGPPYLGETGVLTSTCCPPQSIDVSTPLSIGLSPNGTFAFLDGNGNGLVDSGDAFEVYPPRTARATDIRSYILLLSGPVSGLAYVVVRDRGPLLIDFLAVGGGVPHYFLGMPPDLVTNASCSSRVEVVQVVGLAVPPDGYTIGVVANDASVSDPIPAGTSGSPLIGGGTVRFEDGGILGVLDPGDAWVFDGLDRNGTYRFSLRRETGAQAGDISWVCGVGTNIARSPRVASSFWAEPTVPPAAQITITSVDWVPAGGLANYGVLLLRDGVPLLPSDASPAPLDGSGSPPLGPSADGANTWLTFDDADRNGYLGPGDAFRVNNTVTGSQYELRVFYPRYADHLVTATTWIA